MGCDIKFVFQKRHGEDWIDIPSRYLGDRHYDLYGWIGGAGRGPQAPEAIAQSRGYPDHFEVRNHYHPTTLRKGAVILCAPEDPSEQWQILLGEYGHSWLLANEILEAQPPCRVVASFPIEEIQEANASGIDALAFAESQVDFYDAPGPLEKITFLNNEIEFEWQYDFARDFDYFIDEVRRLQVEYREVRIVFGFS